MPRVTVLGEPSIRPSQGIGPGLAELPEVVVADNLGSKVTMWPKFSSSIEGFETINQAARSDYQRDRVYLTGDE